MNNFGLYVTPEEAFNKWNHTPPWTLEQFKQAARSNALCEVCETEEAWRMAGTGMCFSCTTGEADADDDIELHYQP